MQDHQGFAGRQHWYKGNLHSHTTNSDGSLTPEENVALFQAGGYHFLCLSEHDCYTDYRQQFNTDSFLILPGLEASAYLLQQEDSRSRLKVHHLHGILGTAEMQQQAERLFQHQERIPPQCYVGRWDGQQAAQQLADKLRRHGCFVTYNHPIWSRVTAEDFLHTEGLWAIEVFNYNTVNESGTGYDVTYWDQMLAAGKPIHCFASDDNHNEGLFDDACGGWIMVQADALNHEEIVQNLLSGNYYASAGPEIYDWGVLHGEAYVKCSPVVRINFRCGNLVNAGTTVIAWDTLTEATWNLKGDESWLRIECVDQQGRTAWTNAVFFEQ